MRGIYSIPQLNSWDDDLQSKLTVPDYCIPKQVKSRRGKVCDTST